MGFQHRNVVRDQGQVPSLIRHNLTNHFPNTMLWYPFWTLIELLPCNLHSLYALYTQKTPLTNGPGKVHYRKLSEAWLHLGWKTTPGFHWTSGRYGAALQQYCNLYVFNNMPAKHRHKDFKLVVKSNMRGWCPCRVCVSRRAHTHF